MVDASTIDAKELKGIVAEFKTISAKLNQQIEHLEELNKQKEIINIKKNRDKDGTLNLSSSNVLKQEEKMYARPGLPAKWAKEVAEVLFTEEQIKMKVKEMAKKICEDYKDKEVIAVGLLKGAFCFVADILREFTIPYKVDFMALSSYGKGTESSGNVKLKKDLSLNPEGKHIIILEDLIDTGYTLAWVKKHLQTKKCASVKIACLLDKPARRSKDNSSVKVDYVGYLCPDVFVLGYGMDCAEEFRLVPFVFRKKTD